MSKAIRLIFSFWLFSAVSSASWAGNWTTTKQGYGFDSKYKDNDWSHTFYNSCGFPSNEVVKWKNEKNIRFLRFKLGNRQIGTCEGDSRARNRAPYWERAEIKSGLSYKNVHYLSKSKAYEINFKVRFVEGFLGDRETFFQIHNYINGCSTSETPPVMLKITNGRLHMDTAYKPNSHYSVSGKGYILVSDFYNTWLTFTLRYYPSLSSKKHSRVQLLMEGKEIAKENKVWQSSCGRPHIKFGIYRPGNKYVPNQTSIIDFDYIKIEQIKYSDF